MHALDLDKLRAPDITFWSAWEGPVLLGCGALKELDARHGKVKSMRTPYDRLSLETGSMDAFKPAQRLYASAGFEYCRPFGDYSDDPHSVFMTLSL